MKYRYDIHRGLTKIKTKTGLAISGLAVGAAGLGMAVAIPAISHADSANITFESPTYTIGNINGHDGWSALGSAGLGCAVYDEGVVNSAPFSPPANFGAQSFRISNAVTSGCFSDQAFSKSLLNEAGEADALSGGMSGGTRQPHFEAQFSLVSATKANQGMVMSVSPDRGDGARMSYLRFVDQSDGIHVFFDDVTDPTHAMNADTFNESDIATLSYGSAHTLKFSIDFYNGPDNDVVRVYVDNNLAKTGTSWEDYYRFDTESNPGLAQNNSRTVDSLLFREGGSAVPTNAGNGYLIDNLSLTSGPLPSGLPTSKDQCKNGGWQDFTNPTFKNQGACVSYVATHYKTFAASDSLYYNCATACSDLYGNGAITFNWDKTTGNVTDGYWNEIAPAYTGPTYNNLIVGGTVNGNNVTLNFHRNADNYSFSFNGTLVDNVLTGQMAGPYYFTATGN